MNSHNQNIDDLKTLNMAQVIYGSYVKKERLSNLVYNTYGNSSIQSATQLNVFIDINSVIHALYSEHNRIVYDNITDISAGLINMCAHYRSFFRSIGVDTRFFLINSLNSSEINRKQVANYNATLQYKAQVTLSRNIIDNNMKLLRILCPYLPAIYFVDSPEGYEVGVIIADIIERFGHEMIPNLIISKDLYPIQLCALYPYTSYLYPKKDWKTKQDISWMLPINEKYNFKEEFWKAIAFMRKISYENAEKAGSISPINIALYFALTGMMERDLPRTCVTVTARKLIHRIVGEQNIKIHPSQLMDYANEFPVADIISKYNALDITYALPYYKLSPSCKELKFLDLDDAATVNKIAAKYYVNNPLELQKL